VADFCGKTQKFDCGKFEKINVDICGKTSVRNLNKVGENEFRKLEKSVRN
jgi:hypothetical protein